jgi:uncharacterized membrane protein YeaQ/YmgE (transglycosylase-associated protein family)
MHVIVWLIIGLVAGALARFLVPGRDPMGMLATLILGLVGSVIGGLVGNLLVEGDQVFSPAGLIGSILGAIVALIAYRAAVSRRAA